MTSLRSQLTGSHQLVFIKFLKKRMGPLEKRIINRVIFYPTSSLWINSYEWNHNEEKNILNEIFYFSTPKVYYVRHTWHASVFISFTTRKLPGRHREGFNTVSIFYLTSLDFLSRFTPCPFVLWLSVYWHGCLNAPS